MYHIFDEWSVPTASVVTFGIVVLVSLVIYFYAKKRKTRENEMQAAMQEAQWDDQNPNATNMWGMTALQYGLETHDDPKMRSFVKMLLRHPRVDLNFWDMRFAPPLFLCARKAVESEKYDMLQEFIADSSVDLYIRKYGSIDVFEYCRFGNDWLKEHDLTKLKLTIRCAEQVRLQRAKQQVKVLRNWKVETTPGNEKYLPEDVLTTYVLPYTADVLSPLEEIADSTL